MPWDAIFRAGTHTDSRGRRRTFTTADLDRTVAAFDPARREVPLCFGHPKDNHPAYGWVEGLRRVGDVLQARYKQVPDAVRQAVGAGHFKQKSASFLADGSLRHVALLGAVPPAIEGLGAIRFGADDEYFEYGFQEDTMDEIEKLKKELADAKAQLTDAEARATTAEAEAKRLHAALSAQQHEQQTRDRAARVDALVAESRLLPADKDKVLEFAKTLGNADLEVSFSAGEGKKDLEAHFWGFMAGRPQHGLFNEFSAPDQGQTIDVSGLTAHV